MEKVQSMIENTPRWIFVAVAVVILLCVLAKVFLCTSCSANKRSENFSQTPDAKQVIMFYMEGCTHCVALEPVWKQIEQELGNTKNVIMKRIEANSGHPYLKEFAISGFPTVYKINGDEKIKYDGDRSKADLMKFIMS